MKNIGFSLQLLTYRTPPHSHRLISTNPTPRGKAAAVCLRVSVVCVSCTTYLPDPHLRTHKSGQGLFFV